MEKKKVDLEEKVDDKTDVLAWAIADLTSMTRDLQMKMYRVEKEMAPPKWNLKRNVRLEDFDDDSESRYECGFRRLAAIKGISRRWQEVRQGSDIIDGNLNNIKFKIPPFQGQNDSDAYLKWDKKMELLFSYH